MLMAEVPTSYTPVGTRRQGGESYLSISFDGANQYVFNNGFKRNIVGIPE